MIEITNEHLKKVCKLGQGKDCCRFIITTPEDGIVCGKDDPLYKQALNKRLPKMTAKGDNCKGWASYQVNSKV
ncbi:MAG: hypothetical protein ACXABY_11900 [Candidatus Thorarchaeota archaeon]|jgi:hypothetical protein